MLSINMFGLPFLSVLSALLIVFILKVLNLLSFTLTSIFVLWLSWNFKNVWRNHFSKELVTTSGKAVLITGCDHGFGLITAQALHRLGFTVFACCLSDNSAGAQALRENNIKTLEMDVTNEQQIKNSRINVENYLKESKCHLWAIVNNAGLFTTGSVEWGDITDLTKLLDVNVVGLVKVTRHFLPLIRKSKGRVINIGSCAGRYSLPHLAYYSLSKHAVIAFSDALRREMLLWDIKVITIEPMQYSTPMSNKDTILNGIINLWERTSPEVKSDYGENLYHSFKKMAISTARKARSQTNEVVNAVNDAASNVNPKIRYTCCHLSFGVMWWCLETLPNEILDKVFYLYYKLFSVKPRALDNGF